MAKSVIKTLTCIATTDLAINQGKYTTKYISMSKQFKNPWTKMLKDYTDMRRTLADDASRMALNIFLENFRNQGYLDVACWKRNSVLLCSFLRRWNACV